MDATEKTRQIINFCKKITYRQRVIFSDESNLKLPSHIIDEDQESYAKKKPNGLWYSVGPAWISYLTNGYKDHGKTWEKKRLTLISNIYQIRLKKSLIYCINTEKEFDDFVLKYATKDESKVRWNKVVEDGWNGIEIRYLESRDYGWYEGCDCSSGCLWHPKVVKKIDTLASWDYSWERSI